MQLAERQFAAEAHRVEQFDSRPVLPALLRIKCTERYVGVDNFRISACLALLVEIEARFSDAALFPALGTGDINGRVIGAVNAPEKIAELAVLCVQSFTSTMSAAGFGPSICHVGRGRRLRFLGLLARDGERSGRSPVTQCMGGHEDFIQERCLALFDPGNVKAKLGPGRTHVEAGPSLRVCREFVCSDEKDDRRVIALGAGDGADGERAFLDQWLIFVGPMLGVYEP